MNAGYARYGWLLHPPKIVIQSSCQNDYRLLIPLSLFLGIPVGNCASTQQDISKHRQFHSLSTSLNLLREHSRIQYNWNGIVFNS